MLVGGDADGTVVWSDGDGKPGMLDGRGSVASKGALEATTLRGGDGDVVA